jgi:hypothetical protein
MFNLSQNLHGWTRSVYRFGCAFIHLSNLHDYNDRDPLRELPEEERLNLLEHVRYYHGGPNIGQEDFNELVPFIPRILEKVSGNLECYLRYLESGEEYPDPRYI